MIDDQIRANFKDHVARASELGEGRGVIDWRDKSGSSNYYVRYRIDGQHLIVVGDLGDSVYRWGQIVSFDWVAKCDDHYILGKCQASEVGCRFDEWDQKQCETRALDLLRDHLAEQEFGPTPDELDEMIAAVCTNAESQEEWCRWVYREDADEIFGTGRDFDGFGDMGLKPNILFRYQMIGLRMAVAQLQSQG